MTDFRLRCAQLLIEIQHESALTRKVHAELVAGQPPAVGEVPEMVEWLRCYCANECYGIEDDPNALQLTRAAELLEAFASGVWTVPDGKEPPLAIAEPSDADLYDLADEHDKDHIMTTEQPPLSPAAQAVLTALFGSTPTPGRHELAAALRAAADHVAPTEQNYREASHQLACICLNGMAFAANELRIIAAELEAQQ